MFRMKFLKKFEILAISMVIAIVLIFFVIPVVYTSYIVYTYWAARNRFTSERIENYFLSKTYRSEGSDYMFKLYKKLNNRYVIALRSESVVLIDRHPEEIRSYVSPEIVFFDKEQMQRSANREKAENTVITLTKVDNAYIQNMEDEDCGIKCKNMFRDHLRSIKIRIEDNELTYTGLKTLQYH